MAGVPLDEQRVARETETAPDLKSRSIRGMAATLSGDGLRFVLTLASTIVLSRLLTPDDFGLIAMVMTVTALAGMFTDLGLGTVTVQREQVSEEELTALFWINVFVGGLLSALTAAVAPAVGAFFDEPRLTTVTVAMSGTFLVGGLMTQHQALLRRHLRFGVVAGIQLSGLIAGVLVGVVLALRGHGYWALVGKQIVELVVQTALSWRYCDWRPTGFPAIGGIGSLLRFGGNLTGFNVVNYFARNLDNVLIGRWFGPGSLGLYNRAYQLLLLPLQQLSVPIGNVAVSSLSRITSRDEARYRQVYLRILRYLGTAAAFITAMLAADAERWIVTLLGEDWVDAVPIFQWLAVFGLVQTVANSTGWLFITQDRTGDMLRWGVIGSVLTTVSFAVGLPFGPVGVAASFSLSGVLIRTPLLFWYVGRTGPVSAGDLWRSLVLPTSSAVVVGFSMWGSRAWFDGLPTLVSLALSSLFSLVVLGALVVVLPQARAIRADIADAALTLWGDRTPSAART